MKRRQFLKTSTIAGTLVLGAGLGHLKPFRIALSSGQTFLQLGADGGFLPKPVQLAQILIAPAERADVIVDFSGHENQKIILTNSAAAPYPVGGAIALPQIMQFRVKPQCSDPEWNEVPGENPGENLAPEPPLVKERYLTLTLEKDTQGRILRFLLNELPFDAPVTEMPKLNTTEIWNLIHLSEDTHPIHLHLVQFHILDRRPFNVAIYNATKKLVFLGPSVPRDANEAGPKDTVRANPGEVTRIKASFTTFTGNYVWHCHMLEHEDNDMMRPLQVVP